MSAAAGILVTGATGRIGGHLVRVLSERGVAVRALSRDPAKGAALPGVAWVAGDLAAPGSLAGAFEGVERLFLLTGNGEDMVRLQKNALRAAREAGVLHVVKLSALGASDHSKSLIGLWHWVVEKELQRSGPAWTILRPHHFMQNFLDQRSLRRGIVEEGVVRSPAGEGKIPFIDTRDIAEVAAATLTEPGHGGKTYHLTGPEALSYRHATRILAEATGRDLRYEHEAPEAARARLKSDGLPDPLIAAQLAIADYQRQGGPTEKTTDTVQQLLGRPPRALRNFARDHAGELDGDVTAGQTEIVFARAHFKRRVAAEARARILVEEMRPGSLDLPGTRTDREGYAGRMIESLRALREAGRLSLPEFVSQAGFFALSLVRDYRMMEGDYEDELDPISELIREIEAAHGLKPDEFWHPNEGPQEWKELNAQFDAIVDKHGVVVLREFKLDEIADVLATDPERFHELWLRGVESAHDHISREDRLERLIGRFRKESSDSEAVGAYHAAAATRGAALEGLLLLLCLRNPTDVKRALQEIPAREQPRGLPQEWSLGQLIRVSGVAGWLSTLAEDDSEVNTAIHAKLINDLRNMLHPGRQLKSPAIEVDREELADARAALALIGAIIDELGAGDENEIKSSFLK